MVIAAALFWTKASTGLSKAEIYAVISLCNLITDPLLLVTLGFSRFTTALASFDRIQVFLSQEEHHDARQKLSVIIENGLPERPESLEKPITSDAQTNSSAVILASVSTRPLESGHQMFHGLNVSFPAKKSSLVIGPVGVGKSTFLKAIIGEVGIYAGHIHVDHDDVAYCGEVPWLQNTTIQKNIVGDYPFMEIRYQSIIEACCLSMDINALPDGNETNVGDLGCNLSGGQRQRVALARAIYSAKPIVVLDNSFSGLDRHTASNMYRNLFGEGGLLRIAETTTIMATNSAEHLQFATQVVVLGENGTAMVQTPDNYANLPPYLSQRQTLDNSISAFGHQPTGDAGAESGGVESRIAQHSEVPTEKQLARQRGDYGMYNAYIKSIGWSRFVRWLLLTAFAVVVTRFPGKLLLQFYNVLQSANELLQLYSSEFGTLKMRVIPNTLLVSQRSTFCQPLHGSWLMGRWKTQRTSLRSLLTQ